MTNFLQVTIFSPTNNFTRLKLIAVFFGDKVSAALTRKCLDLNENTAILDYGHEDPKMDCRKLAKQF